MVLAEARTGSVSVITNGAHPSRYIVLRCYCREMDDGRIATLPEEAFSRLLALRTGLRRFEAWSAEQARKAGLTPAQHQLMLAIRGHDSSEPPTITDVANYLLLQHHSAVGLIDRAVAAGLVLRQRDEADHRVVRLHLTELGAAKLEELSSLHLEELSRLASDVPAIWQGLSKDTPASP